jgi:hypothetical protein
MRATHDELLSETSQIIEIQQFIHHGSSLLLSSVSFSEGADDHQRWT